jgi:hypothetical protein
MIYRKEIWYSVHNGGDGSAYPVFMENERQTEIDQRNLDEGWGETCNGRIVLESESPIRVVGDLLTVEQQLAELKEELNQDYLQEYKRQGKYPGWWKRLEEHIEQLEELLGEMQNENQS